MPAERGSKSFCQWFHPLRDCNVCLISGYDIEEAIITKYCAGNWRECGLYQMEKQNRPITREDIEEYRKKASLTK